MIPQSLKDTVDFAGSVIAILTFVLAPINLFYRMTACRSLLIRLIFLGGLIATEAVLIGVSVAFLPVFVNGISRGSVNYVALGDDIAIAGLGIGLVSWLTALIAAIFTRRLVWFALLLLIGVPIYGGALLYSDFSSYLAVGMPPLLFGGVALASMIGKRESVMNNRFAWRWVQAISVIGLLVALAGCGPVNTPSATETPMLTSTPVMTPSAGLPAGWSLALQDQLIVSTSYDWDTGPDDRGTNREFSSSGYRLSTPANDSIEGLANSGPQFSTFYYQATMTIINGTQDSGGGAGLILRSDTNASDYVYSFDSQGNWSFEISLSTASEPRELNSGASPYFQIGNGQPNLIAVKAQGTTFTLYINNHVVATVTNGTIPAGLIGVEVDGGESSPATALFQNARVWTP